MTLLDYLAMFVVVLGLLYVFRRKPKSKKKKKKKKKEKSVMDDRDERLLDLVDEAKQFSREGAFAKAANLFVQCLKLAKELNQNTTIADTYVFLLQALNANYQFDEALKYAHEAELIVEQSLGYESRIMGMILNRRAEALSALKRFPEARKVVLESMRIEEENFGRSMGYAAGKYRLADIAFEMGEFETVLRHLDDGLHFLNPNSTHPADYLNLRAMALIRMGRLQEAVNVRLKSLILVEEFEGTNHPNYAGTLANTAILYANLKQWAMAVEMQKQAIEIRMKMLGPQHPDTISSLQYLLLFENGSIPEVKKLITPTLDRICSVPNCNKVERAMTRCMSCEGFYVCKKHQAKINDHVAVCQKFADKLPGEKKGEITKCRHCRKETELMKCAMCQQVYYCGAECQKIDWTRHQKFCCK